MSAEYPLTISTGQKLRNLTLTVIDPATGLPATVLMEVVSIADSAGNVIDDFVDYNYQRQVIHRLDNIILMLASIIPGVGFDIDIKP